MSVTEGAAPAQRGPSKTRPQDKVHPLVTAYILCVVISVYFFVGPLYLNTLRALLLVVMIPLWAKLLMGHYGRVILTDYFFVAYFLWTIPALVVNNPDAVVQQSGSTGAEFLGGYILGRAYIRSTGAFIGLCKQLAVLTLVLLPFGLLEVRTADPFIPDLIRRIPGLFSVPDVNIPGRMGLNRVQNAFNHPIHYGLFCSVVFSLSFIALKGVSGTAWRWVSSALIGLGCFLALSSGAMLALFLQLGLITWAFVLNGFKGRWWLLVALGVLAYIAIDLLSNRTPLRVFLSYATFSAHTAYWRALIFEYGFQNALDNPLFGIGLNDWERPSWMYGDSMDNFWLVVAVRYGFPAAIFIIIGYLYVLLKVMFRDFDSDPALWQVRRAWVFSFVGLTFTLCTVHVWANIYSFVFFIFASGVWMLDAQPKGSDAATEDTDPAPDRSRRYTRFDKAHQRKT
ncbi:Lipid A core-O-antigen ligase [Tritonibacter multivorans]|uniref:Lipid A core-O-antigen ligase n=1 Tax=Tritonibacter multivorans TaxID=928856 RepID=A0A0P1GGC0_9RHOB|nr:O-antigen ligase family protein [Tritonibacter multivorans]MDA7422741.1 O-antigen ligase family protein [Tritonibacter multivorans]CUH80899.1 Lipid A core-O-antigen ligase [Tritonibacter multivorans]SFD54784.1 O-antigen ligase like membrane protein [Tritonibacter multivorans]